MQRMNVYVWWSGGRLEGGGYDDAIELTDEQYELLEVLLDEEELYEHEITEVNDPRLKEILQKSWTRLTDDLIDSSLGYLKEDYEEDGGKEVWPDMKMWFRNKYRCGVKFC